MHLVQLLSGIIPVNSVCGVQETVSSERLSPYVRQPRSILHDGNFGFSFQACRSSMVGLIALKCIRCPYVAVYISHPNYNRVSPYFTCPKRGISGTHNFTTHLDELGYIQTFLEFSYSVLALPHSEGLTWILCGRLLPTPAFPLTYRDQEVYN
jgi:hypothetical protein